MISREQAGALAALARTVRPAWDQLVAMNAIADLDPHLDLADVAHAVIRAAQDPAMRTPTAIGFLDATHWRPTVRSTETPDQRQARLDRQRADAATAARCPHCDEHGYAGGRRCPHDGLTPGQRAARTAAAARAARAAIRPTASRA